MKELEEAEEAVSTDPERALRLLQDVAQHTPFDQPTEYSNWTQAREIARQLSFKFQTRPEMAAQLSTVVSRLHRRVGDHRQALTAAMRAFKQQSVAPASQVFAAASEVLQTLEGNFSLTDRDLIGLADMSTVLLRAGPLPLKAKDNPISVFSVESGAKLLSDLHWKLATKLALAPSQAYRHVKIAKSVDHLLHQLERSPRKFESFARGNTALCLADLLNPQNQLV